MAASRGDWRESGLIRGLGIPPPSGPHRVGVTHFMHQNLFMRLYYPADLSSRGSGGYQYVSHVYNSKYRKAILDFFGIKLSGLISAIAGLIANTKLPAFANAPLLTPSAVPLTPPTGDTLPRAGSGSVSQSHGVSGSFPALVFSHGLGGSFFTYSAICCDIASHGYVVAAVEHKDGSACLARRRVPPTSGRGRKEEPRYEDYVDEWIPYETVPSSEDEFLLRNKQVKQRSEEVRQALDVLYNLNERGGDDVRDMLGRDGEGRSVLGALLSQFKGRINTELAFVGGHSFGAATSVQALADDPRFKCGLLLDIWMLPLGEEVCEAGIEKPLIFINSKVFTLWKKNFSNLAKLLKHSQTLAAGLGTESNIERKQHQLYTVNRTVHMTQTDSPFSFPAALYSAVHRTGLSPETAFYINSNLCLSFLKRFLHKDGDYQGHVPILDGGEGLPEEVLIGTDVGLREEDWEGVSSHL